MSTRPLARSLGIGRKIVRPGGQCQRRIPFFMVRLRCRLPPNARAGLIPQIAPPQKVGLLVSNSREISARGRLPIFAWLVPRLRVTSKLVESRSPWPRHKMR